MHVYLVRLQTKSCEELVVFFDSHGRRTGHEDRGIQFLGREEKTQRLVFVEAHRLLISPLYREHTVPFCTLGAQRHFMELVSSNCDGR
jgi:hypothetical protein